MNLNYKRICEADAAFLTRLFSIPEYDLYFAENATTEDQWKERLQRYENIESNIILDGEKPIGWIMYELLGDNCNLFIVVLLSEERYKGYGQKIFFDMFEMNPTVKCYRLDVQKRNIEAINFYKKLGFVIVSQEQQQVADHFEMYYNMELIRA